MGLPHVITGAFAAVFPVCLGSERYAVKCFLAEAPDQQARYGAIGRHLGSEEAEPVRPYVVPFEYLKEGIRVGDGAFPVLKMGWAGGVALNRFVAEHRHEPDVLRSLAEDWAILLERLETARITHGDLQHGNVLVATGAGRPRLILVDYDTMFVPALGGRRSPEVGHRNYQHPDRGERDFGLHIDRFAGLVVYTALQACAQDSGLWNRFDTGENLLFRAADFYDPGESALFRELTSLDDVRPLAEALRTACYLEPEAIPALDDVRSGRAAAVQVRKKRRRLDLDGRPRLRRPERPERSALEQAFLPAVLLWILAGVVLGVVGRSMHAFFTAAVGLIVFGWAMTHSYGRNAVVRRRRRLKSEAAYFERVANGLRRELGVLEQEHRSVAASGGALKADRLRALREQALHNRLKHHFVGEVAALEGIHPRVVTRLKYHGIRNAFQATPDQLSQVSGMGDQTRARVALWRAGLVAQYQDDLPDRLSPAEERRLERHIAQRGENLRNHMDRTRQKIDVQERERAQILARHAALPSMSMGRYVRFLIHLGHVPSAKAIQRSDA